MAATACCQNPAPVAEQDRDTQSNGQTADWLHPPPEQEGLSRYVATLRERFWVILLAEVITIGIAVLYLLSATKQYEASADLLISPAPPADNTELTPPLIRESADPTRDVETAARLITNIDVAERVKEEIDSPASAEDLVAKVKAEPVAQSNIVAVVARASSPEDAAELANGFAAQSVVDQTEELHDYVNEVLPGLEDSFEENPSPSTEQLIAQAEALLAGPDPTMRVDTEAQAPTAPVAPRPLLTLVGAGFAGLVLGVAGAFALQVLDPRLRREEQLRRLYRLPILTRIPIEASSDRPLDPFSLSPAASEAYRTLRGTLAAGRRNQGNGSRAILVTGSSPSEGKSTTGINLATSLAAAGHSAILIEADLRRPSIGRALDVSAERGVVSTMIESANLQDSLVTSASFGPNLGLLLADYEGGWISELFSLPVAREMIDEAKRLADYVIIDSPPLTDVVDALPLASYVDDVLVVVRIGQTRLAKLAQLGELLAENGIKPVGFAVVGTPRPSRGDYAYYGMQSRPGAPVERTLAQPGASAQE